MKKAGKHYIRSWYQFLRKYLPSEIGPQGPQGPQGPRVYIKTIKRKERSKKE
jgi:hypothetical protein